MEAAIPSACRPPLGLHQQEHGTQMSVQELVNRGTVLGARDQILVVGRHITTQDVCRLLYLQGRRPVE